MRLRVDASNCAVAQHFGSSVLWSVLYRSVFSVVTISGANVASCVAPGCRRFRGRCGHVRTLRDIIGPGGFNDERFGSSAAAVKALLEGRVKLASVPARPRVVNNEEEHEGIENQPTDTIRGPRDAEPTNVASRRLRNMLPCYGELEQGKVWTRTADWRTLYTGRAAGAADGKKDDFNVLGTVWPVTAGHPAPTLGEPVPPSQRGTRGFTSGAIGSSQSETVTGSREGNMSY